MSKPLLKMLLLCLLCLTVVTSSACTKSTQAAATPAPNGSETEPPEDSQLVPAFPIPTDYQCDETLILDWPVIDSATPDPAGPGSTVELVGHGGVIRCGNAYEESSRDFDVLLEGRRIGSINCYVNHCEGTILLPDDLDPGDYDLQVAEDDYFVLGVQ
jgi:hypothetical protein